MGIGLHLYQFIHSSFDIFSDGSPDAYNYHNPEDYICRNYL
jgi:hypothetical protein